MSSIGDVWRWFRAGLQRVLGFSRKPQRDAEFAAEAQRVSLGASTPTTRSRAAPADEARRVIELSGSFLAAVQPLLDEDGD